MEQFFNSLKQVWSALAGPELTTDLGVNSRGLCALPMPKAMAKAPKQGDKADSFIISKETLTFGFNKATAALNQQDGSVPNITDYDFKYLQLNTQWPKKKANQALRYKLKEHWHSGATVGEAITATGAGQSTVEKIYACFSAGLTEEINSKKTPLPDNPGEGV